MTINYTYAVNSTNYNPAATTWHFRVVSRGAGGGGTAGVVVDDFDVSSGTQAMTGNSTDIVLGVKEQTGTEGTRNFTLEVADNASFTGKVTLDFQVTDGVAFGASFDDGASISINETDAARNVDFTTTGTASGTLYWNITTDLAGTTPATTADWSAINSGGSGVSFSSFSGTISIDANSDTTTEGNETFYLQLREGSDAGSILDTLTITVVDDSIGAAPFTVSSVTGPTSIDDSTGLPTVDIEMTSVTATSDQSPWETTTSFQLNSDGTVSYVNDLNNTSGSQSGVTILPSSAAGTFSSNQYQGATDNWTSDTSPVSGIGQYYQINIRAYNVGTTTNVTDPSGKTIGTAGGNYDFTAGGDNNSSTWFRMNDQTTFTCFEDTSTPSGTYNTDMDVEVTIKEYTGTLGTGTTVFGPHTFTVRARNIV